MIPPEERARRVVQGFKGDEFWIFNDAATRDVAAAMIAYAAEAVAEERAACAKVAAAMGNQQVETHSREIAHDIAAAIRARNRGGV